MQQREIRVPLPGPEHHTKRYLEKYGFSRPLYRRFRGLVLLYFFILLAIFAAWLTEVLDVILGLSFHGADAAMALTGLGALILGYQQWREARHEISMDKYYERLDIANRRQESNQELVHEMMKPCLPELAGERNAVLMYVYTELDNLEYVLVKYRLGYMKAKQACRGLRTFQLRCWSPQFRKIARHRVHTGDYNRRTAKVVERICDEIEALEKVEYKSSHATVPWPPRRRKTDQAGSEPRPGGGSGESRTG